MLTKQYSGWQKNVKKLKILSLHHDALARAARFEERALLVNAGCLKNLTADHLLNIVQQRQE